MEFYHSVLPGVQRNSLQRTQHCKCDCLPYWEYSKSKNLLQSPGSLQSALEIQLSGHPILASWSINKLHSRQRPVLQSEHKLYTRLVPPVGQILRMAVHWKVADGVHGPLSLIHFLIVAISIQVVGAMNWQMSKIALVAHILGQAVEPKRVGSVK